MKTSLRWVWRSRNEPGHLGLRGLGVDFPAAVGRHEPISSKTWFNGKLKDHWATTWMIFLWLFVLQLFVFSLITAISYLCFPVGSKLLDWHQCSSYLTNCFQFLQLSSYKAPPCLQEDIGLWFQRSGELFEVLLQDLRERIGVQRPFLLCSFWRYYIFRVNVSKWEQQADPLIL